jgi:hypothetical protein
MAFGRRNEESVGGDDTHSHENGDCCLHPDFADLGLFERLEMLKLSYSFDAACIFFLS